jgi:hypothetical protein
MNSLDKINQVFKICSCGGIDVIKLINSSIWNNCLSYLKSSVKPFLSTEQIISMIK